MEDKKKLDDIIALKGVLDADVARLQAELRFAEKELSARKAEIRDLSLQLCK